jgi:hypothetical protein
MKNALRATQVEFESSSSRTPEYLAWHKLFKREFTKFLTAKGASNIAIGNPNHFDMSGFFTLGNAIWYFRVGDLRGFKDNMLIRTATHYKDFTGGRNEYVPLDGTTRDFEDGFNTVISRGEFTLFQKQQQQQQQLATV